MGDGKLDLGQENDLGALAGRMKIGQKRRARGKFENKGKERTGRN